MQKAISASRKTASKNQFRPWELSSNYRVNSPPLVALTLNTLHLLDPLDLFLHRVVSTVYYLLLVSIPLRKVARLRAPDEVPHPRPRPRQHDARQHRPDEVRAAK